MRPGSLLLALLSLGLSGCLSNTREHAIMRANADAAKSLVSQVRQQTDQDTREMTIIVTTVSSVSAVEQTNALAQISSEQVAAFLTQMHCRVAEIKLRQTLLVNPDGEFLLSRDIKLLADKVKADYVLVGTYAPTLSGSQHQMTTLKLIDVKTGIVAASVNYLLPVVSSSLMSMSSSQILSRN